MIYENEYKEIIKLNTVEKIVNLINNIEAYYPKLINRLTREEIEILSDVIYDELAKKEKIDNYYECIDKLVTNSIYSSLESNIRLDFNCLRLNKLALLNYFNYLEIKHIMNTIKKRIKQETKCKIIKFEIR